MSLKAFLHLLTLLTEHSISCKPSLSPNIPRIFFCCEPSVSIQPNLSKEHFVSDVCKTDPLSIPCMTDLLSIVSFTCSWVAERSVMSEPQGGHFCNRACVSTVNSILLHVQCMFTVPFDAVLTHMLVILAQLHVSSLCAHLLVFVVQC